MADKNTPDKEAQKAAKEAEKAAEKAKKERIKQSKPKKEGNVFSRAGGSMKKFWKDFVGTVKKVVWPPANQVLKSSVVVLITILVIGLVVFGIDRGLQALYKVSSEAVMELGEKQKSEETTVADAGAEDTDLTNSPEAESAAQQIAEDVSASAESTAASTAAADTSTEAAATETTSAAAEG